ncbi:MAG TPA: hypothetical protein VK157_17850 [Phycisphaerales bacterium]|nr:hypothetical protein [Phycisphaerales bacterium]
MQTRAIQAVWAAMGLVFASTCAVAEPVCLMNLGNTMFRVNADGAGTLETFTGLSTTPVAMTQVPPGVTMTGAGPGDIIAMDPSSPNTLYKVVNAGAGTPALVRIGACASNGGSMAIVNGELVTIDAGGLVKRFDLNTFAQIGTSVDVTPTVTNIGGFAFDGVATWYVQSASPNSLFRFAAPPAANSLTLVGTTPLDIGTCGIEMFDGAAWLGTKIGANIVIGSWNVQTGVFTTRWQFPTPISGNCGFVTFAGEVTGCDDIDFNNNSVFPEDQDVIDFFNVLAGADCPTCNDIDFNNNSVFPEDQDVIDFFNVLAGGTC